MQPLADWQNFYTIVGSAAGALTGLQFVTMALVADIAIGEDETQAGATFSTPTIVHFGTALLLSAVLAMPWRGVAAATWIWAAVGLIGAGYMLLTARRMRSRQGYQPVLEDWIFRFVIPLCAYVGLAGSGLAAHFALRPALFGAAGAVLVLLFLGIHNAWDNVTYLVFVKKRRQG